MATRPSGNLPSWATDETATSGTEVGLATKLEPTSGEKAQGYRAPFRPPARKFNWLINKLCAWIDYLSDVAVINWHDAVTKDVSGAALTNVAGRATDSTHEAFYATINGCWILCGHNTAGAFYSGDHGLISSAATGVASPPKFQFGCETGDGRVLLFDASLYAVAAPQFVRSNATDLLSWTKVTLPGAVGISSQANDAVVTGTGRVVVVGGLDTNHVAWTSDDNGVTWTLRTVGVRNGAALNRVVLGKNGRLVAFNKDTTANGGDKLWYSDDNGVTWTSRNAIGFDNLVDVAYVAETDKYYFVRASEMKRVTDPVTDAFETISGGGATLRAVAGYGNTVLLAVTGTGTFPQVLLISSDGGNTYRVAHRSIFTGAFHQIALSSQGQFATVQNLYFQLSLKLQGH